MKLEVINSHNHQVEAEIPLGLYLRAYLGTPATSSVTAGIDLKGGGTTSYTCTIPAGRTMCVSKVINSVYLPASRYHYLESQTLGEPYVSSGYEMILSGAEATTKAGFWTASGWTFQVPEDSMNSNSVINKMLGFAGIDRLDPYFFYILIRIFKLSLALFASKASKASSIEYIPLINGVKSILLFLRSLSAGAN